MTLAVQSVVATYPPLPCATSKEIMWVGKVDATSSGDFLDYFNGGLLRDGLEPHKVELLLQMSDGSQDRVRVFFPKPGRFEYVPTNVFPEDYLTPSFWGYNNSSNFQTHPVVTNVMWNVTTPPNNWTPYSIDSIVSCIITDSLGEYTVPVIMSTTPRPPPPRRGTVHTIKDFSIAPSVSNYGTRVPFNDFFGPFLVTDDESFMYASAQPPDGQSGCRRINMSDWSYVDSWPPIPEVQTTEPFTQGFMPFGMKSDGSLVGVAAPGNNGTRCVHVSADGTDYELLFTVPAGTSIGWFDAQLTDDSVIWFNKFSPGQLFRTSLVTGQTVNTLFYDDAAVFPWGDPSAPDFFSWDSWSAAPDGTIWFALDGPSYEHLNLNQGVARVRGADGTTGYEVTEIPIQALVDSQGTGFAQNYSSGWGTTRFGQLVFPCNSFNQYGTPDIPTDAEQAWFLLVEPDGTAHRIAGTWDAFGRIPPRATETNIADGSVGTSSTAENFSAQGYNASRTKFYWVDDTSTHVHSSLLRSLNLRFISTPMGGPTDQLTIDRNTTQIRS